ncbi:GWxTD domain-containing protein [Bacteroidota bacterium]
MYIKYFVLFLLICLQIEVFSQNGSNIDKRNYYNFGKKLHAEVHYMPSESPDSITALTLFRFSYDMISFEKSGLLKLADSEFYSLPKFEIEFKDEEGIIRKRGLWQDTVFSDDFDKTISKTDFIHGALQTELPAGIYDADIRLSDKNILNIRKMELKDSAQYNYYKDEMTGSPVFAYETGSESKTYIPYIMKNNVEFSSYNTEILIPVSYKNEFSKYNINCKYIGNLKKSGFHWKSDFDIHNVVIPEKNATIIISKNTINQIEISTNPILPQEQDSLLDIGVIRITLPVEEIVPGEYELKIVKDGAEDTVTAKFDVVWEDMPVILQRPKYAIESMYYILTDDEYEKMLDADSDEYSDEILKYWKNEDHTKFTPYNESMAEYFNRVDYAMFNLRTMAENNGVKTDRGKIYILYGEPTSIDRNLNDDKTFEIWKYDHLKKIFLFETVSQGIFKLIDIKEY